MREWTNEELALKIQAGEREYLSVLWEQIRRLIVIKAYGYKTLQERYCYIDIEDLIQCGYFAMLDSIEDYTSEKGYKFTTYLHYHYKTAIQKEIAGKRVNKLPPPTCSLNEPISEDGLLELIDTFFDNAEVEYTENLEYEELKKIVTKAIGKLDIIQAKVIRHLYYQEKTPETIGKELNLSETEVISLKRKAFTKLGRMKILIDVYAEYFCPYEDDYSHHIGSTPEKIILCNDNWDAWRKKLENELMGLSNGH